LIKCLVGLYKLNLAFEVPAVKLASPALCNGQITETFNVSWSPAILVLASQCLKWLCGLD